MTAIHDTSTKAPGEYRNTGSARCRCPHGWTDGKDNWCRDCGNTASFNDAIASENTRIERVARAMARADGHNPEQRIVQSQHPPLLVMGLSCYPANFAGGGMELWRLYVSLARAVVAL